MNTVLPDDELRRYLLGELSEAEESAVDAELWAQGDAGDLLGAVEDDLIDDFVYGRLSVEERARFEGIFLSSPRRRQRVAFARALRSKLADSPTRGRRLVTVSSPFLALAAMLLLAIVGGWALLRERALGDALRSSETEKEALAHDAAAQRARVGQLTQTLAEASAPGIVSWQLAPGLTRGAAQGPILALAPGVRWVRLSLRLDDDRYPTYRVTVQTVEGGVIATITGLHSRAAGGRRAVECMVPAQLVPTGSYVLQLGGDAPGRASETVDFYYLRVA